MTLQQAETVLNALIAALESFDGTAHVVYQTNNGRRELNFTSQKDLDDSVARWSRIVATKKRMAAGGPRHGHSLADFR